MTVVEVAQHLQVSIATLYRHLPAARATVTRKEPA
jgi:predicted site-specific integrase-resolvase